MRKLCIVYVILLISTQLFAQERIIKGIVQDQDGNPIENVTVKLKGSEISTQTDINGTYEIKLPSGNYTTLTFSHPDKEDASATIGLYDKLDIEMNNYGEGTSDMSLEELLNMNVTTASKSGEKLSDAPGVLSVLSKDEIERFGGETLRELLSRIPGLTPTTGYLTDKSMISIRGDQINAMSTHVLYLINGRPVREVHDGGISSDILETFPVDIIEKIEVIKGPGSVLYGSNAFSGVINIITQELDKNTVGVKLLAGTGGSYGMAGNFHVNLSELNITGAVNYLKQPSWDFTLNFPASDTIPPYTPVDPVSAPIPVEATIEKYGLGAFIKAEYKGLSLSSSFNNYHNSYFLLVNAGVINPLKSFTNLGYKLNVTDFWNIDINTSYTITTLDMNSYPMVKRKSSEIIAELTNFFTMTNNLNLIVGGSFNRREGEENLQVDNSTIAEATINGTALYTQLNYKPFRSLKLIAGAQLNMIENIDADVVPRLGAIYYPIPKLNIKAIYAQAFRAPAINDVGLNFPSLVGNPDLLSEKVSNTDFSATYNADNWQVGASYFYTLYNRLIVQDFTSFPGTYLNLGELTIKGFEIESKFYVNDKIFISASFLQQHNEDKEGHKNISFLPYNQAKIGVSYKWPKGITASLFHVYRSKLKDVYDDPFNPKYQTNNLLDLYIDFALNKFFNWNKDISLYVQGTDLMDQQVWSPNIGSDISALKYPMVTGREVYFGIKVSL
jgi:outer membrane receptor for ferrienterochelin and colicins